MKTNKAFKYRAYPNKEQEIMLAKFFGCVRFVYNHFLNESQQIYKETNESLSYSKYCKLLTLFKQENIFLKEVDSIALQQSLKNLDAAYKGFFEGKGFPKYKSKHKSKKSYTTKYVNSNIHLDGNYLTLPKIGKLKLKLHRQIPQDYKIKSATVSQNPTGKYYVSITCEYESQVQQVVPEDILGLDYSSPCLYIDSNGNEPDYEKQLRKYEEQLAKEQRKLARKYEAAKKESRELKNCKNYQKQKRKVAKIYEKIANCRKDALHKLSREIADNYDAVGVENINLRALSQCLKLGKSTMDNGFGMFRVFLQYKLENLGKHFVKIDKWYPSTKTCSNCGNIKPMKLNERTYVCPECGAIIPRDWNAAINIKNETIRILKQEYIKRLCLLIPQTVGHTELA